jgi:hypothetical protein
MSHDNKKPAQQRAGFLFLDSPITCIPPVKTPEEAKPLRALTSRQIIALIGFSYDCF